MTLCMAVACELEDEPRIVLCHDWKEESDSIGSFEHTDKLTWVHDKWPTLTAGSSSRIEEILRLYRRHLKHTVLTEDNYFAEFKAPAQLFKAALADDYIQQMLGITYPYFLEFGKERLPEEIYRDRLAEIGRMTLQASLIIAGFLPGTPLGPLIPGLFPVICVIDGESFTDAVREETHFASIGSGTFTANAALYNRGAHEDMPLLGAIYAAFEAHRMSQSVPGVGDAMSIDVLEPGGIVRDLSDEGYDYCEFLWKKFGPKGINEKQKTLFQMKDEFLGPDLSTPSTPETSKGQQ